MAASSSHPPHSPVLLARVHANMLERSRRAARLAGGVVEESEGVLLTLVGAALPPVNSAIVLEPPAEPAALVERARAFFERYGVGWVLKASATAADVLDPHALAAGLTPGESLPGLALAPLIGTPKGVPGLAIRRVADAAGLRAFIETSAARTEALPVYELLYPLATLDEPDLTLYLGYIDGEPVATVTRTTSHRIAGIGGVSVLPRARRRGIGEAITWRAALDGLDEGCIASFLQSTAISDAIYRRMGYRPMLDLHTWNAPASK